MEHSPILKNRGQTLTLQVLQADMHYEAGLVTGYKYHCNNCDYVGAFVIEKEIPTKNK